jgi:hypothetical protein
MRTDFQYTRCSIGQHRWCNEVARTPRSFRELLFNGEAPARRNLRHAVTQVSAVHSALQVYEKPK